MISSAQQSRLDGALAQLGERLICIQEVRSSILLGSTIHLLYGLRKLEAVMKIAAITMVYQDHWALKEWVRHYGEQLGKDNLFIFAHGKDDIINRIADGANVITIPRDDLTGFDRKRGELMNGLHQGLSQVYDWIIRTDADELICTDPNIYPTLWEMFCANADAEALFALGFDLVETRFEPSMQLSFTGHYSKAFATKCLPLAMHGVRLPKRRLNQFDYRMPDGTYLAHLKYANMEALSKANTVRQSIASGSEAGLPGEAWRIAEADSDKFLSTFNAKPIVDWVQAVDEARSLTEEIGRAHV